MKKKKKKTNVTTLLTCDLQSDKLDEKNTKMDSSDLNSEDIGDKVNLNEGVSEKVNKRKHDSKSKANKSMKIDISGLI